MAQVRSGAERPEVAARPETPSIAVLPFANLSPEPDQEYFCDGMTEEIITALSKIRGLRVISRNSAVMLKGTRKTMREIGELLHVGHVIEGSVRKSGNNLRITAQLIDAGTDAHIWAERYAGTLDDIFDIQEKVALAITDALRIRLNPNEQKSLTDRRCSDARVLECYHRARHETLFATKASLERAIRLLQQGLDTLGEHALLYMGLAHAHWYGVEFFLEPYEEGLQSATEFTRRLQELDPRYAPAILAKLERFTGSQVRSIRHFEDAVVANPGDVDSLWYLTHSYSFHMGKPDAGSAAGKHLLNIDPLTVANLFSCAFPHWADGNFAQALAIFDDMRRREPGLRLANFMRMQMFTLLGRMKDASDVAEEIMAENPEDALAQLAIVLKHALHGDRDRLLAFLTGEFETHLWNDPEVPEWVAGWLALVGEREKALDWLEHWIDRGSINYPMLAHSDPLLEPLRGEPRFQRLLDRIHPEWERFVPRFQAPD